jgi:hypothetical protein
MHVMRMALLLPLLAAGTATASPAADRRQCAAAYEQGQRLRRQGQLREARAQLNLCARDVCNRVIQQDCVQWVGELDRAIPTLVLRAQDADGKDVSEVQVSMDGNPLVERLDGRSVEVDPGAHAFRFESAGLVAQEMRAVIGEGEKTRELLVRMVPPEPPRPPQAPPPALVPQPAPPPSEVSRPGPSRWPVYAAGGVGAAGLVSFTVFGLIGHSEYVNLTACKGHCSPGAVDAARTKFIVADASLGVSVAAVGLATYLFFRTPAATARVSAATVRFAPGAVRVDF